MAEVGFYSDMLQDPFIHNLNGEHQEKMTSFWEEVKTQVRSQIISGFGLDFIDKTSQAYQDGGAVDTIHNAYNGIDIKNEDSKARFESNKNNYNSKEFHKNSEFNKAKREIHKSNNNGQQLKDDYTGLRIKNIQVVNVDHIIPGKQMAEDKGIAMAGLSPEEMANRKSNYAVTNSGINQSKSSKTNSEYVAHNGQRVQQAKENLATLDPNDPKFEEKKGRYEGILAADEDRMLESEKDAEHAKNVEVSKAYYGGAQFRKDTAKAAGVQGFRNAKTMALQLVILELEDTFFDEIIPFIKHWKDYAGERLEKFKEVMVRVKNHLIQSVKNIKDKALGSITDGFLTGMVSTVVTTIINMFATTAKSIVRILNDGIMGLYNGVKLMITNPDHLETGKLMKKVFVIITTAVTASVGVIFKEFLRTHLAFLGPLANPLAIGISAIVTGFTTAVCVREIDNLGSAIKKFKVELHYAISVSKEDIKNRYLSTIKKIDDSYEELMKGIVSSYDKMDKLSDLAHDLSLAADIQLNNSVEYARYSGVSEKKILHNKKEIRNYFLN